MNCLRNVIVHAPYFTETKKKKVVSETIIVLGIITPSFFYINRYLYKIIFIFLTLISYGINIMIRNQYVL